MTENEIVAVLIDPSCPWCKLGWPTKDHPVPGVCGVERVPDLTKSEEEL